MIEFCVGMAIIYVVGLFRQVKLTVSGFGAIGMLVCVAYGIGWVVVNLIKAI